MTLAASDRRLAQATVTLAGETETGGFVNSHAMLHHRWFPASSSTVGTALAEVVTMSGVEPRPGSRLRRLGHPGALRLAKRGTLPLLPPRDHRRLLSSVGTTFDGGPRSRRSDVERIASSRATVVLGAERDIRARLKGHELDFSAMSAVSNIYRSGSAVRNHMEREVLSRLRPQLGGLHRPVGVVDLGRPGDGSRGRRDGHYQGDTDRRHQTLHARKLIRRIPHRDDRRRVPSACPKPANDSSRSVPEFNRHETLAVSALSDADRTSWPDCCDSF